MLGLVKSSWLAVAGMPVIGITFLFLCELALIITPPLDPNEGEPLETSIVFLTDDFDHDQELVRLIKAHKTKLTGELLHHRRPFQDIAQHNTPRNITGPSGTPESIRLVDTTEFEHMMPSPEDEPFLADLKDFTLKLYGEGMPEEDIPKILKPKKKMLFYIIPRWGLMCRTWRSFMWWFKKKDKEYYQDDNDTRIRKEWEVCLGMDAFHPYFKYKEAQKMLRDKFSFETPSFVPRMKVRPEIKNRQFRLVFIKKF